MGEAFPHRHIILFLTFCVIFTTLVLQGLSLPWLARKLAVEETDSDFESEVVARSTLLEELVAEIDNLIEKEENVGYRESLERWRIHYQDRLKALKGRIALPTEIKRYTAGKDRHLISKLMDRSRRRLATMRRRGLISEEVRRRIEYDFDMEEQRLKQLLARIERG